MVVLDNEAIQALVRTDHPKHRLVLSHLELSVARRRRNQAASILVPTAARVEAGWDRRDPRSVSINRLRIIDHPLDRETANEAADIVNRTGVTVADAHVGAAARTVDDDTVVVLTSDPTDIELAAGSRNIRAVRI